MNAFNRNGDGEFTERKIIVTDGIRELFEDYIRNMVIPAPKQPEIQSVDLLTDEAPLKAKVQWKRPQLEPLESPIDRYNLWYKPEGDSQYMKKVVNGTEDNIVLDGLCESATPPPTYPSLQGWDAFMKSCWPPKTVRDSRSTRVRNSRRRWETRMETP